MRLNQHTMKKLILLLFIPLVSFGQTAEEYFNDGIIKDNNGDYYGAIKDYSKAIDLDPNNYIFYLYRANAKISVIPKDFDGACPDFKKAANLGSKLAEKWVSVTCDRPPPPPPPSSPMGQFSIQKPQGWFDYSSDDSVILNVKNILGSELTDDIIEKSDLGLKEMVVLHEFMKYSRYFNNNGRTIPSVKVILLKNYRQLDLTGLKNKYTDGFFNELVPLFTADNLGDKFKLVDSGFVTVDDKQGVFLKTKFDFNNPDSGLVEKYRSTSYYFFVSKNYYVQISLNDTEKDDCEKEFNLLLKSLKL